MLVVSYLQARRLDHLWYQTDAGDRDPATLFHYLGLAARRLAPRRSLMPGLTPEHMASLSLFSRRFFEELWGRLKRPAVMVLDNHQEVAADSLFHAVLAEAATVLPEGVQLLVLSQIDPPPAFARLRLQDALGLVDGKELRLTLDESRRISTQRGARALTPAVVKRLHQDSGGWAAGFVLLLEQAARTPGASRLRPGLEGPIPFDFLAGEVFGRMDAATQQILLQTALLPKVGAAQAAELTGHPEAPELLARLHRHGTFTVKTGRGEVYEYHPMLRAFLLKQAQLQCTPEQLRELRLRAAALLDRDGQTEAAVELLREAQAWSELGELLVRRARSLVEQGRSFTLDAWISFLPEPAVEGSPWLLYWHGASLAARNPARSAERFAGAFELFHRQGDEAGMFAAWSGGADTCFYGLSDEKQLRYWLRLYEENLSNRRVPSPELEARVCAGRLYLLMHLRPNDPEVVAIGRRAMELAEEHGEASLYLYVGCYLAVYQMWMGDYAGAGVTLASLLRAARSPRISALLQATVKTTEALYAFHTAAYADCLRAVREGLAIAEQSQVHVWTAHLLCHGIAAAVSERDASLLEELEIRIEPTLEGTTSYNLAYHHFLLAWRGLVEGDLPRAEAQRARASSHGILGAVPYQTAGFLTFSAQLLHARGEQKQAAEQLAQALAIAREMGSTILEHMALAVEAWCLAEHGRDKEALEPLVRAFALGRQRGYFNFYGWSHDVMSRLCALALAHGVEPEYARALVRRRSLAPPPDPSEAPASWPWRIKVLTLGHFQVLLDDQPLTFTGKAQRRPLELLMALVAFGGRHVAAELLADALWPGADADAARQSLTAALHRLRKLLRDEDAIILSGNHLALRADRVWVDTWAFERLLSRADSGDVAPALDLYQGAFLHGASDASWAVPTREKLRAQFRRYVLETSQRSSSDAEAAVRLLERGLEADPLAEELYRELMRRHASAGRRAEAMSVYQRCERVLEAQLGIAPAADTQAAFHALRESVSHR